MASFDFIEASAKGYEFVWSKASYILHISLPVIFVKVFCLLTAFMLQIPFGSPSYGLIVLPSYAIEAVFIVGLIRYYIYKEPIYVWGKMITPPDTNQTEAPFFLEASSQSRKKPMQAGIASYLLVWVILLALAGIMPKEASQATPEQPPEASGSQILAAFLFFGALVYASVWSLRLMFAYIPLTLNYKFTDYLKNMAGFKSSFLIAMTIITCTIPILIINVGVLNLLEILFTTNSAPYIVGSAMTESILGIFTLSIQVIAITYGICNIMSAK